ncbi:MAG: glycosyltransferase family 2 protein [Spirochaetales bacterium]|nr:glycosyltransferase family 2 protein [Spirochaetales bacterium]
MKPKISVVIITYNQEKIVSRAIESVIKQRDYIFELILSDDCSKDNTWEILKEYKSNYPSIVKIFKNSENLGIFKHIEKTWEYPTGDLIFYLAGDDEFEDNVFKITAKYILDNIPDYKTNFFTIYLDYKAVLPNGSFYIKRNNLLNKFDPISLKIRGLITNRTTGVSVNVLKAYKSVKNIGIYTDGLQDIQTQIYSQVNYYIPFVGSIYYKNIGVGASIAFNDAISSKIMLYQKYKDIVNKKNDILWLNYQIIRNELILKFHIKKYIDFILGYIINLTLKYGITYFFSELKHFIFTHYLILKRNCNILCLFGKKY